MHETVKYVWLCMAIFTVCALIATLPYEKWQKAYLREHHRLKSVPQRRIEQTNKYVEDIEDGTINTNNGIYFDDYLKQAKLEFGYNQQLPYKRYQKPLFIRDKYNPAILHPYLGR